MEGYLHRHADAVLDHVLASLPAAFLTGPRAVGKTTTGRRRAASVLQLDRPSVAEAVRADPDAVLHGRPEPVLIDEWQLAPEILGAVKRSVDEDPRPGRFLIAGSVRARTAPTFWPGTGRLVHVPIFGLTQREILGRASGPSLIERLLRGEIAAPLDAPDLREYVRLALCGGYPGAVLAGDSTARARWLASYATQAVTRDALELARPDTGRLQRYLEAFALNSAGTPTERTIHDAADVSRITASAYESLLADLAIVGTSRGWTSNRLKRLTLRPKRYVLDPGLLATLLSADEETVMADGDLIGRLIETFVVAQIRPELALVAQPRGLHHLRTQDGRHEIDVIVETAGGVVAIEIKAGATVRPGDARHLVWLRDQLGTRFLAGAVLHTGPLAVGLGDRIVAAPIAALWSAVPDSA